MTYPLHLTADQFADVAEHYADDWPTGDDLLDDLCGNGEPCDGHCGDAGCPVYEHSQRRLGPIVVRRDELGDEDRDAIPF